MKKKIFALALMSVLALSIYGFDAGASNIEMSERLKGRLLLQVEKNGEAWYVHPDELRRYYLGRPADAFELMKVKAIGVSNRDFEKLEKSGASRLAGKIIMKAEDKGQAYYIDPTDKKMHYLGRPEDALKIMQSLSTGIKDRDIERIESAPGSLSVPVVAAAESSEEAPADQEIRLAAKNAFNLVNLYRTSKGMQALIWSDDISAVCEQFSQDMATKKASFSHDGFNDRVNAIKANMDVYGAAENIAWNYNYPDPASRAVDQWLNSTGHKKNIDGNYKYAGMGAAKSADGEYYFTQIFIR